MKKLLFLLAAIFFFISCSKQMNKQKGVVLNTNMRIFLSNQQGEDLLNPETPGAFDNKDIYTFVLNNDGTKTILQKNLVWTLETGQYYLYLNEFNLYRPEKKSDTIVSTIYLHLNDQTTDTIKVDVLTKGAVTYISKAWYNSDLKWTGETIATITIVK